MDFVVVFGWIDNVIINYLYLYLNYYAIRISLASPSSWTCIAIRIIISCIFVLCTLRWARLKNIGTDCILLTIQCLQKSFKTIQTTKTIIITFKYIEIKCKISWIWIHRLLLLAYTHIHLNVCYYLIEFNFFLRLGVMFNSKMMTRIYWMNKKFLNQLVEKTFYLKRKRNQIPNIALNLKRTFTPD